MAGRREGLLLLSRSEAERLTDFPGYVEAIESGLRAAAEGRAVAPPAPRLEVERGAFHVKGGALPMGDRLYVAIKSNGNFPGNPAPSADCPPCRARSISPMAATAGHWR